MNICNLSVRVRLILLILIPNIVLLATIGYGVYIMKVSGQRMEETRVTTATIREAMNGARKAQILFKSQVQGWKNLLIRGGNAEDFDTYRNAIPSSSGAVQEELRNASALMASLEIPTKDMETAMAAHQALEKVYLDALDKYDAKDPQRAQVVDRAVRGVDREVDKLINEVAASLLVRGDTVEKDFAVEAAARRESILVWLLVFLAAALSISISAGVYISSSIIRPLRFATEVAERVAKGDLTTEIQVVSKDETGRLMQSLQRMNASLAEIVSEVRNSSEAVSTASEQIATGNAELSARTEQQASSLEETAASMEELASTVRQNAQNAREATGFAVSASELASKGGEVVGRVVRTMQDIQASSKKISEIIGVIDGIAFQTNILALNASVEAARAGEQGRGFAVVASEVRNLAQRSATAAKEIKGLIAESVHSVDAGSELVNEAGRTITDVVASVKKVSGAIGEIAAATGEQSTGINQVNEAVTELDRVTQQNAQLVDESANASESARQQALRLAAAVAVFKVERAELAVTSVTRKLLPVALA